MLVGLVSDIHGTLPDGVHNAFANVDYIICAGDMCSPSVLWELDSIAPTIACLGNNDWQDYGSFVRREVHTVIGGASIAITHYPQDAARLAQSGDYQLVVHGHTHVPCDYLVGNCRVINPGSTTRPRGGSDRQCATLRIEDGVTGVLRVHLL